jgi:apolipoprotein N-acyltransferase
LPPSLRSTAIEWAARVVLPALLSAALLSACFPPIEVSFLAWIALAPLLISIAHGATGPQARAMGFLHGLALAAWNLSWLASVFGPTGAGLWILFALFHAILFGALAEARDRWGIGMALALSVPLALGIDFFRGELWPLRFGWLMPGYALAGSDVWIQAADLGGVYGLSAALVGCAAVLARATLASGIPARARWVAIGLAIPTALAAYGAGRLRQPLAEPTIPVALLQYESQSLEGAIALARDVPPGVRLIVGPEIGAALHRGSRTWLDAPETARAIAKIAREHDATVVIGGMRDAPGDDPMHGFWNSLAIVEPDGTATYTVKAEPVPLFADGAPSERVSVTDTGLGTIGTAICYDATHPHVIEQLAPVAGLLVIASGDLASWSELQHAQHARMVRVRAVEHRRYVARATSSGYSQVIDPRGDVLAELGYGRVGVVTGRVALREERTVRDAIGAMIPRSALVLTALVIGWLLVLHARSLRAR